MITVNADLRKRYLIFLKTQRTGPVSESLYCLEAYESLSHPTSMVEKVPNENGVINAFSSIFPTGTESRDISIRPSVGDVSKYMVLHCFSFEEKLNPI
jgi:hypothetical protein